MTDRAQPGAIDSVVRNYELGDIFGQFSDGWVVPADEPTASAQRSGIDETAFTAFDATYSASSLTVTIGPGEAFVNGWLATDTPTDVDLAASTAGQTVGVSWDPDAAYDPDTDTDRDAADRVVVALEDDVSSVDPFLPLWTFDTDGSGVMGVVDERDVGSSVDPDYLAGADIPAAPSGEFLRKTSEGLEFAEIVAGVTVQETEPLNPKIGEPWYDTNSGLYKVYADSGDGADWQPVSPVQVLEEASTFTEDDVTVTHTDTELINGSIGVGSAPTHSGTSIDRPTDSNTGYRTGKMGIIANPNADLAGVAITVSGNTGEITNVTVHDGNSANDPIIASQSGTYTTGDTIVLDVELTAGNKYAILGDDGGDEYAFGRYYLYGQYPYTSTDIDLVNGYDSGDLKDDNTYIWSTVEARFASELLSGDVLIEWDSGIPTDINSYDLATFQRSEDGETVTIDVEDGNGNVLFSDIGPNFDISAVDTSKNVKLRANLSRTDTANNPTLDYAARRYTR